MTHDDTSRKPTFLLILAGMFLVLFFTFQTAEISNGLSTSVTEKAVLITQKFGLNQSEPYSPSFDLQVSKYNNTMRAIGHISVYFLVTLIFQYYFYKRYHHLLKSSIISMLSSMTLAVIDENIQKYVPGRGMEFIDWLKDLVGITLSVIVFCLLVFLIKKIRKE